MCSGSKSDSHTSAITLSYGSFDCSSSTRHPAAFKTTADRRDHSCSLLRQMCVVTMGCCSCTDEGDKVVKNNCTCSEFCFTSEEKIKLEVINGRVLMSFAMAFMQRQISTYILAIHFIICKKKKIKISLFATEKQLYFLTSSIIF